MPPFCSARRRIQLDEVEGSPLTIAAGPLLTEAFDSVGIASFGGVAIPCRHLGRVACRDGPV